MLGRNASKVEGDDLHSSNKLQAPLTATAKN
jgi:hypothetical protein